MFKNHGILPDAIDRQDAQRFFEVIDHLPMTTEKGQKERERNKNTFELDEF